MSDYEEDLRKYMEKIWQARLNYLPKYEWLYDNSVDHLVEMHVRLFRIQMATVEDAEKMLRGEEDAKKRS